MMVLLPSVGEAASAAARAVKRRHQGGGGRGGGCHSSVDSCGNLCVYVQSSGLGFSGWTQVLSSLDSSVEESRQDASGAETFTQDHVHGSASLCGGSYSDSEGDLPHVRLPIVFSQIVIYCLT